LLEVLVDDHPGEHPQAGGDLGHSMLGCGAGCPERDHVARHRRCAGRRAGDDRAVPEALQDGVGETGPTDRRRESQLIAAGQEDAGRVADRQRGGLVVGLGTGHRVERPDLSDAELGEDRAVALAGLQTERRCGADDRDRRIGPPGQRDETAQDDAVADLVLRAADDDDGSIGHRLDSSLVDAPREDSRRRRPPTPIRE
jgi:hypothetical protein